MLAYIDGGTGGIVLQVLLGGIVGGVVVVKAMIGGFFQRFRRTPEPQAEPQDGDGSPV